METLDAAGLGRISLEEWEPVRLALESGPLVLEQCLRLLPGKRLAARGRFQGQPVFAKVFLGDRHEQLARRELETLEILWNAGVRVPRPLRIDPGETLSVVMTEWLDFDATPYSSIRAGDRGVLDDLLEQLDRIYKAGFYQKDLHLDNFVVENDAVRVLDTGAMERLPSRRRRRTRSIVNNLALLCAQAPLDCVALLRERIQQFFVLSSAESGVLASGERRARMHRIRRARKKWVRACTAVRIREREGAQLLLDRHRAGDDERVQAFALDPEQATLIKRGSRIHVYATDDWILKEYRDTSLRARIKKGLGQDSARRSWVMGWTFDLLGIPTPRPLAWARLPDRRSVILYPRINGPRLSELMEQEPERAESIAPAVREWLSLLGMAGCWHGDTKAQNVLVINNAPWLIDLDAAGWSRWGWRSRFHHRHDVERFHANRNQFVPGGGGFGDPLAPSDEKGKE